jgi:putative effector of murein hydrolase
VKFKETKVTPWLLVLATIVAPIFVFIGVTLQNYISGFWPFIEKITTAFVFLAFAYPIYAAYEKFNARIVVSKGALHLK